MIIKGRGAFQRGRKLRGFTLVELLVVIGIIGILATTIMVNLSSGRDKAKAASVLQSLRSVQPTAASCLDSGGTVNAPTVVPKSATVTKEINGGNAICSLSTIKETWPLISDVAAEWHYSNIVATQVLREPTNSIAKTSLSAECPAGSTCATNCIKAAVTGDPTPVCLTCKLPGTTGSIENNIDCSSVSDLQQVTGFNGGVGYGTQFQYGAYSDTSWMVVCNQTSCKKVGF